MHHKSNATFGLTHLFRTACVQMSSPGNLKWSLAWSHLQHPPNSQLCLDSAPARDYQVPWQHLNKCPILITQASQAMKKMTFMSRCFNDIRNIARRSAQTICLFDETTETRNCSCHETLNAGFAPWKRT